MRYLISYLAFAKISELWIKFTLILLLVLLKLFYLKLYRWIKRFSWIWIINKKRVIFTEMSYYYSPNEIQIFDNYYKTHFDDIKESPKFCFAGNLCILMLESSSSKQFLQFWLQTLGSFQLCNILRVLSPAKIVKTSLLNNFWLKMEQINLFSFYFLFDWFNYSFAFFYWGNRGNVK